MAHNFDERTFSAAEQVLGPFEFRRPWQLGIEGDYNGQFFLQCRYVPNGVWQTVKVYDGSSALTETERINLDSGGFEWQVICDSLTSGTPRVWYGPL